VETSESAKNVAVWSLLSALNYVHKCSKNYTAKKKSKKQTANKTCSHEHTQEIKHTLSAESFPPSSVDLMLNGI